MLFLFTFVRRTLTKKIIIDSKFRRPFIKLQIDRVARWCHAVQYLSRIRNVSIIFLSIYNCLSISFLKRSPSSLCSRCSWKGATSGSSMCGKHAAFVEHFTLMQKRDHLNNIYHGLIEKIPKAWRTLNFFLHTSALLEINLSHLIPICKPANRSVFKNCYPIIAIDLIRNYRL